MQKSNVVLIPAIVDLAVPGRDQYKQYKAELAFDGKVIVEIPIPAEHVRKEGDKFILTLKGWTIFLDVYSTEVEKMDEQYKQHLRTAQLHKPY